MSPAGSSGMNLSGSNESVDRRGIAQIGVILLEALDDRNCRGPALCPCRTAVAAPLARRSPVRRQFRAFLRPGRAAPRWRAARPGARCGSSPARSGRRQARDVVGEGVDVGVGQSLHRRGHVSVDVAAVAGLEGLELRGQESICWPAMRGTLILPGKAGPWHCTQLSLPRQGRRAAAAVGARLAHRRPRFWAL